MELCITFLWGAPVIATLAVALLLIWLGDDHNKGVREQYQKYIHENGMCSVCNYDKFNLAYEKGELFNEKA